MKNKLGNQKKIQRLSDYIIKIRAKWRMHLGDFGVGEERCYAEEILRENIQIGRKEFEQFCWVFWMYSPLAFSQKMYWSDCLWLLCGLMGCCSLKAIMCCYRANSCALFRLCWRKVLQVCTSVHLVNLHNNKLARKTG